MTPNTNADSADFPGDPSHQPLFGLLDTARAAVLWSVGLPHLAAWTAIVRLTARLTDLKRADSVLKLMSRAMTTISGVRVEVEGAESLDSDRPYVFVSNHVNIFDMFALYQSIPQYTRSIEHIDHFKWPLIGQLITAAGQIPVDPADSRLTASGLRRAASMLKRGESVTVLPEGSRTLDGSVGPFFPGAFRLAIRAGVPVVPIAIRGGRAISRRGDWRLRPGKEVVLIGTPIPTSGLKVSDAVALADRCRQAVIDLLHGRKLPGQ